VLLSVGVAEALGIHNGDTIRMRNADMQNLTLTVSGIYDNHVYNYAIVSPQTILEQWGALPAEQMAFVKIAEDADVYSLSARIAELPDVMNVAVSDDLADMVRSMMDALNLVVWVIVFCAGLLAAIVLYNLTNININERIREIATIKVLGFNSSETAAYVFKENLSLTAIGALFGLLLGKWLLMFVMSQIKIDMVWFQPRLTFPSYIRALLLTMVSACLVDFLLYFKLEKINMAEALKSVE
jgi:putative ABC transport system permease protein